MNHTHGAHAIRPLQTTACPTLRAMMTDQHPPAERLRRAARQLDAGLDAGDYSRLASLELVSLRGLVWMMDETAEQIEAAEMAARPVRGRPARWWGTWFA